MMSKLFLTLFILVGVMPGAPALAATPCPADDGMVNYDSAGGRLHLPSVEVVNAQQQTLGFVSADLQAGADERPGIWFELLGTTPLAQPPAWIHARYNVDSQSAEVQGYLRKPDGSAASYHQAQLELDSTTARIQVTGLSNLPFPAPAAPVYHGNENMFPLIRGGADQFLLPVEVGNQVFNLLVDTGSDALIIFEDRLDGCNRGVDGGVQSTGTELTKAYAGGTRSGVLASAPVRIGAYSHPSMRIMLVQSPGSQNDASLTAKGADGIIGLRRTGGLNAGNAAELLDAPLKMLNPQVDSIEFNLPPAGDATLAFGNKPLLDRADNNFVFRAKALNLTDPARRDFNKNFADMQIPFRAKTSYGEAADDGLDILLDTGAVSRLVLDTKVAEKLGYDPAQERWMIDENADIELNLIGITETLTLQPKFKVWEVSVAPYSTMGVEFEAVLGISRWQEYVVDFDFIAAYNGGPDATISLLRRLDINSAVGEIPPLGDNYPSLPGLNSVGNDEYPSTNNNGTLIAFQSDRPGGAGGLDIYVWRYDTNAGLIDLPGLNSAANERRPYLSGDGRWLVFESDRGGVTPTGFDVYLYDLQAQQLIDLPGLNSSVEDLEPVISDDGGFIAFTSRRNDSADIFIYNRAAASVLELPGINTSGEESAPTLTSDGRYLSFVSEFNAQSDAEIRLYDVFGGRLLPLSQGGRGINTDFDEQAPTLNLNTLRLAFHGNRNSPELGLYDRDIFVVDALNQIPLAQAGLNSAFDDSTPRFSGDGQNLLFQSRRPGGLGGADIYLYRMNDEQAQTPPPAASVQDIRFTATAAGLYSVPVTLDGQGKNLLVASSLNALLLFRDSAVGVIDTGLPASVPLGPIQLSGTLGKADVSLGGFNAAGMNIVLLERADVAALGIVTDGLDGLLGLSHALAKLPEGAPPPPPDAGPPPLPDTPLRVLQPAVNLLELDFSSPASAGMTLNRLPLSGGTDAYNKHNSVLPGEFNPDNPAETWAETLLPFIVSSYADGPLPLASVGLPQNAANDPRNANRAALSTLLQDLIILDSGIATALGYDAISNSWPGVSHIDLSFLLYGSDSLLPAAQNVPVNQVLVLDLSAQTYRALLGVAYWGRYVAGIDYINDGSNAVLFLSEAAYSGSGGTRLDHHFVPLAGINTPADETNGAASIAGVIAFESNRPGGAGDTDVYVWRLNDGLLDLPGLNSPQTDQRPSLNGDGTLLAFDSMRNGNPDVFVYDLNNRVFIDLPGLNTGAPEEHPILSADGSLLAYNSSRDGAHNGSTDLRFYHLPEKRAAYDYSGWLNTNGEELEATLSGDGALVAFSGIGRADGKGGTDVLLYNLQRDRLVELPRLNTAFQEAGPALSADGNFLAFFSNRYNPDMSHLGNDVMLMELSSGELLSLPGLNSAYEDVAPALTPNAEFILFHSKRPGGMGGYDLYVYQRDLDDRTRYTVSQGYHQEGYVVDAAGARLSGVTVTVTDGEGRSVSTTSDADGNFSFDIPVGAVLPLRYSSAQGSVVVDGVGDDTYIPDFEAGNLKFSQVWVEDTLQSGMPSKIWFDVETETPKYNTFVKIYLVKLPTGSVDDLDVTNFTPDYSLTALNIENLGHNGSGAPVTETQDADTVTAISYFDDNKKAHVEHSFRVPPQVADGTYAAVFSIGRFDYHPEDDALQSEDSGDKQDNYLAAPASVIVGQPTLPNLRILSAELNSNSFELPKQRPDDEGRPPFGAELVLNMEVESMAQDTQLPVDVVFSLNLDGQSYPLFIADSNGKRPLKLDHQNYPVTCRAEDRDGYPAGDRCASLFRQEQQGYTYKLYLSAAAYDALALKTADSAAELVIQLDPANTVTEWENNKADNIKVMPVMYLAPRSTRQARSALSVASSVAANAVEGALFDLGYLNDYSTVANGHELFSLAEDETYGNDLFGVGYTFNAGLTYAEGCVDGDGDTGNDCDGDKDIAYPYAAAFDGLGNTVDINIFGNNFDILKVDAGADLNGDQILCSWFGYDVQVLGVSVYFESNYISSAFDFSGLEGTTETIDSYSFQPTYCNADSLEVEAATLWSSMDMFGNELYTASKVKSYKKTFVVGSIPITVEAGVTGDLGIRGTVGIDTSNTLDVEVGPYAALTGFAEGGVGGAGFSAGVGIELLILSVDLPFHAALQVLPSEPLAIFTFEAPLVIRTLDGRLYLFLKTFWNKYKYTILGWTGYSWEIPLIDPIALVWAEPNQLVRVSPSDTSNPLGLENTLTELDYDWGTGSAPSEAQWQGTFDFEMGTYTFAAQTDDNITVRLDTDGDNSYDTTVFGMSRNSLIDHAGGDGAQNGTLQNGPVWSSEDALSGVTVPGSMVFDGNNDYVEIDGYTGITGSDDRTVEAWIKTTANSGSVFSWGTQDDHVKWVLHISDGNGTTGAIRLEVGGGYIVGNTDIRDGNWHHIAVSFEDDGTPNVEDVKLYVDGGLESPSYTASQTINTSGNNNVRIGLDRGSVYFNGSLDEVRIWNVARNQSEIQASMDAQLSGNEDGLVALLPLRCSRQFRFPGRKHQRRQRPGYPG